MIFKNGNVWRFGNRVEQRAFDFVAGHVLRVQNPAFGMAAFPAQIQFVRAVRFWDFALGKFHAEFDQFLDPRRAFLDNRAHDIFLTQTRARFERVAHVQLERILLARHRRDAALRIIRVRLRAIFFVTMATRPRGATFSANESPAMPLPRMRKSNCFTGRKLTQRRKGAKNEMNCAACWHDKFSGAGAIKINHDKANLNSNVTVQSFVFLLLSVGADGSTDPKQEKFDDEDLQMATNSDADEIAVVGRDHKDHTLQFVSRLVCAVPETLPIVQEGLNR